MKELELTLRFRNNRLKERRDVLGMNQPTFAAAAGVSLSAYRHLESLRRSPRLRSGDGWRDIAVQLANFHCVEPEELFPPAVLAIETPVACRRLDREDLVPLLSEHQERLLESPDGAYDRAELREQSNRALASLRPRDAKALRLRLGWDDGIDRTLEEVGAELGVTRERVRECEARALRRLRHPCRSKLLCAFLPSKA